MNAARYLNVDCVLHSEKSLAKSLSSLKDDVFILWDESLNGGSFIGLETNLVDTSGPEEDIAEFLRLFDSPSLLEALSKCQEKTFDIGFESGDSGDLVDVIISSDIVNKISELGFSI
ncbi:MAG: hypothetical protein GY814_08595, partial [Gammaproteobacteria bacterium]|nr:hypothetical protein [Gammaproteobacteria bacterium]